MSAKQIENQHVFSDREVWTVMGPDVTYTVHATEPTYSFLFGAAFDTQTGEILRQQFEMDGERVQLDA